MNLQLKSLRVIGCGPFQQDTLIDFCDVMGQPRPITVLGGANGSGKTTVLELIVALYDLLRSPTESASILSRTTYAQLDWLSDQDVYSICYGPLPSDATLTGEFISFECDELGEIRIQQHSAIMAEITAAIHEQEQRSLDFALQQHATPVMPSILYLPYYRRLLPVHGEQIQREEVQYRWIYRYEAASTFRGSLDSYLIWLDYAEPETFRAVCDFLNSLSFDGKTFGVQRRELKAVVIMRDGQTHDVSQLSSGEQNILITLLELRRRLVPHSLVLIDEIENSLHPAFQHRIAQGLRRLQAMIPFQLIVSTHAPAFVEIFGEENTLLLTQF